MEVLIRAAGRLAARVNPVRSDVEMHIRKLRVSLGPLLIMPAAFCILLITIYPLYYAVRLSLLDNSILRPDKFVFVGFKHYLTALTVDPLFWQAFRNTLVFTVLTTVLSYLSGLGLALILNHNRWGTRFFQAVLLLPWVMPSIVIAVDWKWIFHTLYGILNWVLLRTGAVSQPIDWLGSSSWALLSVTIANIWKAYPFMMISLLAQLKAVPAELYEAAMVDGASPSQVFRYVTFPFLRGISVVITILMMVWTFNYFDLIYLMTGGGPSNASEVLATLAYRKAFRSMNFSYASALSTMMLVVLFIGSVWYVRMYSATGKED